MVDRDNGPLYGLRNWHASSARIACLSDIDLEDSKFDMENVGFECLHHLSINAKC